MLRDGAKVAGLLVALTATAVPSPESPCGCDPMPAPVHRAYRQEPEEQTIALLALESYFQAHPPPAGERVCVTLPGHQPAPRMVRDRLEHIGMKVERHGDCRFEEGRTIWSAAGVWRTGPAEFVAHVIKSEFGDVSLFLEGYEYTLEPTRGEWRVTRQKPSPCNPPAQPKDSGA
jgi:hypothetical protein